jgi:secreted trypsin-like serine protease
LIVTGWGYKNKDGGSSKTLLAAKLALANFEACKDYFADTPDFNSKMREDVHLCAQSETQDSCGGDSGGNKQNKIN